jgi:enhancing lycopene biosynthesis protein 2
MARVGVVLSGCGFIDGAEIQEAVFTLLFLDRAGATVECFAPNKPQMHVVNHLDGEPTGETRNVLVESARIARGKVRDLAEAKMDDLDALALPGGYGVAKNLSSFATAGKDADVDEDLVRLIGEAVKAKKPILAICISPAILAAALAKHGATAKLTIGDDAGTAEAIEALGSSHQRCPVERAVVDEEHKIVSTPAYMLGPSPKGVAAGIEQGVAKLMSWLGT